MTLEQFFKENNKAALAFSGGTDSSLLLHEAIKYGCDVQPYFIKTLFQPQFELDDGLKLCEELGISLKILHYDVTTCDEVIENTPERCYLCKKRLFGLLLESAKKDGYDLIIDGTNASDDASDRPGMRALREMKVRSPLKECGITKSEVRKLSEEAGLFTASKPSYACLATRIPTGSKISAEALNRVEKSESLLFDMGFSDLRVRSLGDSAKIQLKEDQFQKAIDLHDAIVKGLSPYFKEMFLDLKPR